MNAKVVTDADGNQARVVTAMTRLSEPTLTTSSCGGDGVDAFDFSDNTTGVQVIDLGLNGLNDIGSEPPIPEADF